MWSLHWMLVERKLYSRSPSWHNLLTAPRQTVDFKVIFSYQRVSKLLLSLQSCSKEIWIIVSPERLCVTEFATLNVTNELGISKGFLVKLTRSDDDFLLKAPLKNFMIKLLDDCIAVETECRKIYMLKIKRRHFSITFFNNPLCNYCKFRTALCNLFLYKTKWMLRNQKKFIYFKTMHFE